MGPPSQAEPPRRTEPRPCPPSSVTSCRLPSVTCEAGTSLADAARTMREAGIGSVIVTERGKVAGILTERDLLARPRRRRRRRGRVRRDVDDGQPRRARARGRGRRGLDQPGPSPVPAPARRRRARARGRGVVARPHGRGPPAPRRRARDRDPRRPRGRGGGGDGVGRRPGRGGLLPLPPVLGRGPGGHGGRSRTSGTCCSRASSPTRDASRRFAAEVAALRGLPPGLAAMLPEVARKGTPFEVLRTAVSLLGRRARVAPHARHRRGRAAGPGAAVVRRGADDHGRRLQPGRRAGRRWSRRRDLAERGELPVDGHGRRADAATRPCRRAVPDPHHRPRVQRVDVHGPGDHLDRRRPGRGGMRGRSAPCRGRLHGGAPSRALAMLDDIATAERAEAWLRAAVERGDRVMGFGHRVYKTDDPAFAVPARRGPLARGPAGRAGRRRSSAPPSTCWPR